MRAKRDAAAAAFYATGPWIVRGFQDKNSASLADLGAALLVFEVLKVRRSLQLAARSAILVAVSPVLFVASGIHGDNLGVAVASGAGAGRRRAGRPRARLVHFGGALAGALFAAWVPSLAWGWDSLEGDPGGGSAPGGLGPPIPVGRGQGRPGTVPAAGRCGGRGRERSRAC